MTKVVFIYNGGEQVKQTFLHEQKSGCEVVCLPVEANAAEKEAALQDAEILVLMPAQISDDLLQKAKKLKLVQVLSAGYDKINLELCRNKGIIVANNGGANSDSVAVHSVAMLLAMYRCILDCDAAIRQGAWRKPVQEFTQFELAGKTVGIMGAGHIGSKVAQYYHGLDARIIYYAHSSHKDLEENYNAKKVELDELVTTADIISIHLPLLPSTKGLLGAREFAMMKANMVLVNTGRAEIVDTAALIEALAYKRIAGACLDVFTEEPLAEDSELLHLENVLLSPHMAGHSAEGWVRRARNAWTNIELMAQGKDIRWQVK